ncbi:aryl-sulfate sulfotransferase [Chitinolyticbacter albus]|uniref:aryl-sulfate sulfotransferase n=1 Tax=Chitinolyticbacter albus TaxID=2961951 RepID=UPI00210BB20B|nr:aryl-sulfate sulfotransferase [Chitinolyticbacter albus]
MGHPTVYPTGATRYDPEAAWSGYTLFQAADLGALLIDMNGREVKLWRGLQGFPNKLLPGGQVLGSTGRRDPQHGFQDQLDLVQVDWDGKVVWRFSELEHISDPGQPARWYARQHHDFQREGNPVGYYAPQFEPRVSGGSTLLLVHEDVSRPEISEYKLLDDKFVEVSWDGKVVWEWRASDHYDELGFDEAARAAIYRNPNLRPRADGPIGDWLHINSLSRIGANRHYDQGDERFHPDNIIWDARDANLMAITDRRSGKVVWRLGPRYDGSTAERELGWIIGQHHAHIIPRGLPGEGNLLVFDNGGWAGYGEPHPAAPQGVQHVRRDYSRVLEIDPVTLAIVWQYTPAEAGFVVPLDAARFYSPFISSAQRLPNGNTLITEGANGRIFEVTREHTLVWEYISPYWGSGRHALNLVYRAYRVPYDWVPQLPHPDEVEIATIDVATFRVPGAAAPGRVSETVIAEIDTSQPDAVFCVLTAE